MKIRQVFPLLLAYADNSLPIIGRTRLQKMIFLLQAELDDEDDERDLGFGFMPYNYGPYSRLLQYDIDALIDEGLLAEESIQTKRGNAYRYYLTDKGKDLVVDLLSDKTYSKFKLNNIKQRLEKIKDITNSKDLDSLLQDVYERHPEYAKNSLYEF